MTFKELAEKVLLEEKSGQGLTAKEIWDTAVLKGYDNELGSSGKTPWRTIGAILYVDIRDNLKTPFAKTSKGGKFYLKKLSDGYLIEKNIELQEVQRQNDQINEPLLEKQLHRYLTFFVDKYNDIVTKTINDHISKKEKGKKNLHKWKHPDIVGVYFPKWEESVIKLSEKISLNGVKFYSYEMKRKLDINNLRESFFQAVSNSSWANEGYLVAEDIVEQYDQPDFYEEFKNLNNSFGIGLIKISTTDPNESKIIFQAKQKNEIDIDSINSIAKINKDFKNFIQDVFGKINDSRFDIKKDIVEEYETLYSEKIGD